MIRKLLQKRHDTATIPGCAYHTRLWYRIFVLLALAASTLHAVEPNWEKMEGCTIPETKWADGDSFHIEHNGQDIIIRLYFVDCPEESADQRFPVRIAEQARYFGISSEAALKVGDAAATFTKETLSAGPFVVWTCGQDAMGASSQKRIYGIVETQRGNLAELLVKNGLARIYGKRITLPSGKDSRKYLDELAELESSAKTKQVGAWAKTN